MTSNFIAGFAKADITPEPGMPMAGYINRVGNALGAHDPLNARVLYLSDGYEEVLIVSMDLIRIDEGLRERVVSTLSRNLGIKPTNVLVAATHTHSGPEVSLGLWSTKELSRSDEELIRNYLSYLSTKVNNAALRAIERASEVSELRVATYEVRGVATNRVLNNDVVDRELTVLSIKYLGGGSSLIMNYACHPTVLGPDNLLYSGDLAGLAVTYVEDALGSDALYLNGAAGNVSTRFSRNKQDFEEAKQLASIIGEGVVKALLGGGRSLSGGIEVKVLETYLRLKPPMDESYLRGLEEELRAKLIKAKESGAPPPVLRALESDIYAVRIAMRRNSILKGVRSVKAVIKLVKVGDLPIITFPGELFVEYQLSIKKVLGKEVIVAGYTDGYLGYVPYLGRSKLCYEEIVSLIDESEYPRLKELLTDLVRGG